MMKIKRIIKNEINIVRFKFFIQNIEYKFVELLSIDFVNSPDDTVRKQIGYRYNALRTKMEMMQERIIAINNIIKIKNPSLLHQINKAPSKFNMKSKSTYSTSFIK